jgi:methyl-accepting chemotaxis protein
LASISDDSAADSDDEEAGFLEKLADIEGGMESLGRALGTTTEIMGEITGYFNDSTERIHNLEKTSGNSAAKLALANRLASLLEDSASRLEVSAGEYAQSIQRMEPGMKYLLSRLASEPDQLAEAPEFPRQVSQLIEAAESTIPMTMGFKKSIEGIGSATRSLRRVARRIATTLQSLSDSSARVANWKPLVDGLVKPGAA